MKPERHYHVFHGALPLDGYVFETKADAEPYMVERARRLKRQGVKLARKSEAYTGEEEGRRVRVLWVKPCSAKRCAPAWKRGEP